MNEFTWKATGYAVLFGMGLVLLGAFLALDTASSSSIDYLSTVFLSVDVMGMTMTFFLFVVLINDALRDRGALLYLAMVVELFFHMFFVVLQITLRSVDGYDTFLLVSEYAVILMTLILNYTLWYYIQVAADRHGQVLVFLNRLMMFLFVFGLVFILSNAVFNHMFYIVDGQLYYPLGHMVPLMLSVILSGVTFFTVLMYVDTLRKKVSLGAYIVIPFSALCIGEFIGGTGFIYIAFLIALFIDYSNVYVKRRQELTKKDAKLLQQRADILISQIQPHFLYNALTSIMNIKGNPPETRDAIADFGKYLRGNLDTLKQKGPIPILLEMDHVETFSQLVRLNSGDDLSVEMDIRDRNFLIPSLTVQSVLEYIIEFGFGIKHMEGRIDIMVYESDTAHNVVIKDDHGLVRKCFDMSNGSMAALGLSAVETRMKDMVGGSLSFNSLDDDIVATVSVPKKTARGAAAKTGE